MSRHQHMVAVLFDDSTLIHHGKDVGMTIRRESVRNYEADSALAQNGHRDLDEDFSAGVDFAVRIVGDHSHHVLPGDG